MQTMPNTSCPQRVASDARAEDARADVADPTVIVILLEFSFRKPPIRGFYDFEKGALTEATCEPPHRSGSPGPIPSVCDSVRCRLFALSGHGKTARRHPSIIAGGSEVSFSVTSACRQSLGR